MDESLPVAGWYQDPEGGSLERLWSGQEWTVQTRERSYVPLAALPFDDLAPRVQADSTRAQWWIALSPIWIAFPALLFMMWGIASEAAGAASGAVPVIAGIALLVLAYADRRELARKGYRAASPLWMFLGPLVYLGVRYRLSRDTTGASWLALVVLAVQCVIVAAAALLYFGITIGIDAFKELHSINQ